MSPEKLPFLELVEIKDEPQESESETLPIIRLIDVCKIVPKCFICDSTQNIYHLSPNQKREKIRTICQALQIKNVQNVMDKVEKDGLISKFIQICTQCNMNLEIFKHLATQIGKIKSHMTDLINSVSQNLNNSNIKDMPDCKKLKQMILNETKAKTSSLSREFSLKNLQNIRNNLHNDEFMENMEDIDEQCAYSPPNFTYDNDNDSESLIVPDIDERSSKLRLKRKTQDENSELHPIKKSKNQISRLSKDPLTHPNLCEYENDDGTPCNFRYKYKSNLTYHINKTHKKMEKPYKCHKANCTEAFTSSALLFAHTKEKKHNKKSCMEERSPDVYPILCGYSDSENGSEPCKFRFKTESSLEFHNNKYHKKMLNPYTCSRAKCEEAFSTFSLLANHIKHTHKKSGCKREKIFNCIECCEIFESNELLTQHEKDMDHQPTSSSCNVCKREFSSIEKFRQHLGIQGGKCLIEVSNRSNLPLPHNSYIDDSVPNKKYVCGICGKRVRSSNYLKVHIEGAHFSGFSCEICQKRFKQKSSINNHMRGLHPELFLENKKNADEEHIRINNLVCQFCSKVFSNASSRKKHEIIAHTKAYSFTCDTCGFGTASASTLSTHLLTHSTERNFTCEECGMGFKRKDSYKKHMRTIHSSSEQKNFLCDQCEKSFWEAYALKRHKELVHMESVKKFYCAPCDFSCALRGNFLVHLRTFRHKKLEQELVGGELKEGEEKDISLEF